MDLDYAIESCWVWFALEPYAVFMAAHFLWGKLCCIGIVNFALHTNSGDQRFHLCSKHSIKLDQAWFEPKLYNIKALSLPIRACFELFLIGLAKPVSISNASLKFGPGIRGGNRTLGHVSYHSWRTSYLEVCCTWWSGWRSGWRRVRQWRRRQWLGTIFLAREARGEARRWGWRWSGGRSCTPSCPE